MKKHLVIVTVAAGFVSVAGFLTGPDGAADSGEAASTTRHESRAHSGTDEPPVRSRARLARKEEASFEERAAEIDLMKQTTERDDSIRALAQEWAAEDAVAAEQWATRFVGEVDRVQALNLISLTHSNKHPEEAIAMAERNRLGDALAEEIVGRWANRDFKGASDWVAASEAGDKRNALLAKLALVRAAAAPEEAATLVALSMREGHVQEEAAMSVLHQWLRKDLTAAAEWLESFPDGPLKERGRMEVEGMKGYAGGE